jgi:peptidoglycan hydrolase-like protein with peptidoglycan-binding domain
MADPGPFKRPLYPPSHDSGPVPDGDDISAVKRAVSRAGFFPWQTFDDAYNEAIADGVKQFQKKNGIKATGNYGSSTHDRLRQTKVPQGKPNAGLAVFDDTAAKLYKGYKVPPPAPTKGIEDVRAFITEFCMKGLGNTGAWNYSQSRPVTIDVNPSGSSIRSDCSGSVIQAVYYAKKKTGLPVQDPAQQGWSGYGNTDLHEDDWPTVSGSYQVGDLAHYQGHVTLCMKAGDWSSSDWWSFGSEPPTKRKLNYRTDFRKVVRPGYLK